MAIMKVGMVVVVSARRVCVCRGAANEDLLELVARRNHGRQRAGLQSALAGDRHRYR